MKKLLVVTALAVIASAIYPAAACDWNREASTQDPAVAAADQTPQAAPVCSGTDCAAPQPTSVASEDTARKAVDAPAPIVLISDRK